MHRILTAIAATLLAGIAWAQASPSPANVPQAVDDEFHFVVLGDAQFHDPALFNRVVDQARRLRPAFVIQVGDLIEGYNSDLGTIRGEWQRFGAQVAPLEPVPYLPIPGNHDVYGGNKKPDARLEQLYTERWGPLYYSFNYKNTLVVALNSDSTEAINAIRGEQWRWLVKTLGDSRAQHKFVFLHRPALLLDNADELHALFRRTGVSRVFYGHHHHYHHLQKDGVHYTMTNAAATSAHSEARVGSFHHLLQVAVRGDEVDVAVIRADAILAEDYVVPQDNYDMFELTRRLAPDTVPLEPAGTRTWRMALPLRNTTARDILVYVTCESADERWTIEPGALPPVSLAAGARETLDLTVSYAEHRKPESVPECHLRVPLQTGSGHWIDFNAVVVARD